MNLRNTLPKFKYQDLRIMIQMRSIGWYFIFIQINIKQEQSSNYGILKEQFKLVFKKKLEECMELQEEFEIFYINYQDMNDENDIEKFPEQAAKFGINIEKIDYQSILVSLYMKLDTHKPLKQDLQQLIQNGRQLIFDIPWLRNLNDDLQRLLQEYEQGEQIEIKYNNEENIQEYVFKALESFIASPHSQRIYEGYAQILTYNSQVKNLQKSFGLKYIEMEDESESGLESESSTKEIFISLVELDELEQIAKNLEAPPQHFELFKEIRQKAEQKRQCLQQLLERSQFNENVCKKARHELKGNQFDLQEVKELETRIQSLAIVQETLIKKQPLEKFYEAKQIINDKRLDDKWLSQINSEIVKAENLRDQFKEAIGNGEANKDRYQTIKKLLLTQTKVELPERKQLQDYVSSIEFIEELHPLYLNNVSQEHEMEIEEKSPDVQQMLKTIQDPFRTLFDEKKPFIRDIVKLIQKYENVNHPDPNIKQVALTYQKYVWVRQAENLVQIFSSGELVEQDQIEPVLNNIDTLGDNGPQYEELKRKIIQIKKKVNELIEKIEKLVNPERIFSLLENQTTEIQLSEWLSEYKSVDINIINNLSDQLETSYTWILFAINASRILRSQKITQSAILTLREIAETVKIPETCVLLKQIKTIIQSASKINQQISGYERERENFFTFLQQTAMQRLDKPLNKKKTLFKFAQELVVKAQQCKVILKIDNLLKDIELFQQIQKDFDSIENAEDLQSSLNPLHQIQEQLSSCPLSDQDLSDRINLEVVRVKFSQAIHFEKVIETSKVRKHLEKAYNLLKLDPVTDVLPDWIKEMINEFQKAEDLEKKYKILNNIQKKMTHFGISYDVITKLSLSDFKDMLTKSQNIQGIKIDYIQQALEEIQTNIEQLQRQFEQIKQKGRASYTEIEALYRSLKTLPVEIEEEKIIMDNIKEYDEAKQKFENLRKAINDSKNYTGKQLESLKKDFESSYKNIMIIIPDADQFIRDSTEFSQKLKQISQQLQLIDHNKMEEEHASDNIHQEFNELKGKFCWGSEYENLILKIWQHNCQRARKLQRSCNFIKNLLEQGYQILDKHILSGQDPGSLKENILYLETLITKIKSFLTMTDPEDSHCIFDNRIDLFEYAFQLKTLNKLERSTKLEDFFKIKRPFEDINAYKNKILEQNKHRRSHKTVIHQKQQEKQLEKQQLQEQRQSEQSSKEQVQTKISSKRKVHPPQKDNEFLYEQTTLRRDDDQEENITRKKIKNSNEESEQVQKQTREQQRKSLLEIIKSSAKKNQIISLDENKSNELITNITGLENQIFGEHHLEPTKYLSQIKDIKDLFKILSSYPYIFKYILYRLTNLRKIQATISKMKENNLQNLEQQLQRKKEKQPTLKQNIQLPFEQKQSQPYNPLQVKALPLTIPINKHPSKVANQTIQPKKPIENLSMKELKKPQPKPRIQDSDDDFPSSKNRDPFAGKNRIQVEKPEKQQKEDLLKCLLEHPAQESKVTHKKQDSDSSPSQERKLIKNQIKKKQKSRSSSSDLPDYGENKIIHQSIPILCNPDNDEEVQIKPKVVPITTPLQFGDTVYFVGRSKIRQLKSDASVRVEFYMQQQDTNPSDMPQIDEIKKMSFFKKSKNDFQAYIQSNIQQSKDHFMSIIGWIYPRTLVQLDELNNFADDLKQMEQYGQIELTYGKIYIAPIELLKQIPYYQNFVVPEKFLPHSIFRDEHFYKQYGKLETKLGFILSIKDINTVSKLSNFTFIKEKQVQLLSLQDAKHNHEQQQKQKLRDQQNKEKDKERQRQKEKEKEKEKEREKEREREKEKEKEKEKERIQEEFLKQQEIAKKENEKESDRIPDQNVSQNSISEHQIEQISEENEDQYEPITSGDEENEVGVNKVDQLDSLLREHLGAGEIPDTQQIKNQIYPPLAQANQRFQNQQQHYPQNVQQSWSSYQQTFGNQYPGRYDKK